MNDGEKARSIAKAEPALVRELVAQGGQRLNGIRGHLEHRGSPAAAGPRVPVDAPSAGDGYWEIQPNSTALHMARGGG